MQPQRSIDVSILIVSYNTREMTLAALDSVYAETRNVRFEVIVVDNASTDGSAQAIADHPGQPRLIALDHNIGFARGNNLASEHAAGEYLLLLNPDTVVKDRAIDRLVSFAHFNPHARIWGGRTLFGDGALNPSCCWRRITLWNLLCRATGLTAIARNSAIFNSESYGGWKRDSIARVDIVSGCFFLITRDFWRQLGGFDPLFFMYGEEADLCLRAQRFGARPVLAPQATIIHYGGASEATRAGKMVKLLAAKASLVERHFHPSVRGLGLALLAAWPLSRMIALKAAATLTRNQRLATGAATWAEIWRRRKEWQHGWSSPDDGALPGGLLSANAPGL